MDSTLFTRRALQRIGVSPEEIERYIYIDKKLRHNSTSSKDKAHQRHASTDTMAVNSTKETEMEVIETRLRGIVLEAVMPLESAIEEIKSTIAREMQDQRLLLRNQLDAVQNDTMAQLKAFSLEMNQRQKNIEAPQQQSCSSDRSKDQAAIHAINTHRSASVSPESTHCKEPYNNDSLLYGESQSAGYRSSSDESPQRGVASVAESYANLPEQHYDLSADLEWFKAQVTILQEEHRQYRQELRRQEHQQMLQQNVSVSKSELQEELESTKNAILSSVKAFCSFMEVEISSSLKQLHEESINAVVDTFVAREESNNAMGGTRVEPQTPIEGAAAEPISDNPTAEPTRMDGSQDAAGIEGEAKQSRHERSESETLDPNTLEQALERFQALAVGQSQRVIDKIRNPTSDDTYVFRLTIPQFETLVGSGKKVYSYPCALDFMHSFLVVRGVASFPPGQKLMSLGLERMVDVHELGLENGKASSFIVKPKVKAPRSLAKPDLELSSVTVRWEDICTEDNNSRYVQLGSPVACHSKILKAGLNSFENGSLLIEFEITLVQEQRSRFRLFNM